MSSFVYYVLFPLGFEIGLLIAIEGLEGSNCEDDG